MLTRAADAAVLGLTELWLQYAFRWPVRKFREANGYRPRIACPRTYAERMLWRKLIDHSPLFVTLTDKLAAKEYGRRLCPDLAYPENLWIGRNADDIPDAVLEGDVFVKTNHSFNHNYPIRNGQVDRQDLKAKTDAWLASVHGGASRQWAYSQIEPKLFVEPSVGDAAADMLEISIRAAGGVPILGSVAAHNKLPGYWMVYLDIDGRLLEGASDDPRRDAERLAGVIDFAEAYARAVEYTRRLSVDVDYARFDFMWNGAELYGGEVTIYPAAGTGDIEHPIRRDLTLAGWDLRAAHFVRHPPGGWSGLYARALKRRLERARR